MQKVEISPEVEVRVQTTFVPEESDTEQGMYLFAYKIRITNKGSQTVQLLSRHWIITDAYGHVEEVKGPGVVGEQPFIRPDGHFEYSSACPLPTPTGSMHGTYLMEREDGSQFFAQIPQFYLVEPMSLN
jgi:ApaG protein